MKYIITIIDRLKSNTVHHLERTEDNINQTIEKELNGWDNLYSACTSCAQRDLLHKDEYFMAGTTKDNSKAFSILCVVN